MGRWNFVHSATGYAIVMSDSTHVNWLSTEGTPAANDLKVTEHKLTVPQVSEVPLSGITQAGKAGPVTYAYAGAPEAVALDQDRAGKVLLVEMNEKDGARNVTVEERQVGRTRFERHELDANAQTNQPALIEALRGLADPDLVLDVRLVGVRRDELDLDIEEIEAALAPSFLKVRVRDASMPALTEGTLPSADTIAGAFIRDLEARIAELEASGAEAEAGEQRDALRLGRLLLVGHEVSL